MINRTLAYLILFTITVLAGCFLVVNFYRAEAENNSFNWQNNSFNSRQMIQADATLDDDLIN
ncbi:MAG: hypothetical protein PHT40_02005 [Patescibacteria group bacterium]|nr:hypothetical protein [Patescibacteria group bacterium]